jgi:hypothetical protein
MPYSAEHERLTREIAAEAFPDEPRIAATFVAMIRQESGFDLDVIQGRRDSPAGARGIAQLMPVHWAAVDPLDPPAALRYAAGYLHRLLERYRARLGLTEAALRAAVAAYNWGPGNVDAAIARLGAGWESAPEVPEEKHRYLAAVLGEPQSAGAVVALTATVTAAYGLRLRAAPSDDAPVLAVAPPGSPVALPRAAWYPVRWQGQAGWMWGEYLAFAPAKLGRAAAALALLRLLLAWAEGEDREALAELEREVHRLLERDPAPA